MTGKPYRLLTEAEDEYATRAGTQTAFPWGEDLGKNNAACLNCGTDWDNKQESAPVGSFKPNAFGLYDMVGNVYGWVEDCYNRDYNGAPTDGSAWLQGDCKNRMARGGSWFNAPVIVRSANRAWFSTDVRLSLLGFRVARTLIAP
jgi:formylglycine-generating enzyme required for sulfatase activity